MKRILMVFTLLFAITAFAGFGGARSSGGSFGGSRSSGTSFGGARSSGSRVTITRPPSTNNNSGSTVVHNYGNSGGSGSGFVNGLILGHVMSQPNVVVAGQPGVVYQSSGGMGFFGWFFVLLLVFALLAVIWYFVNKEDYND